ncbi:MAG: type VI secretion system baseplate subunit TssF [Planctomycetota bacterium]
MTQTLFQYYDRELHYQKEQSRDFADRYPAAAGRLRMDATGTGDPHVERLIQSVSLMAARVHKRLDDDLPEITDALLSILYPHYLRPIPSMAVVQLIADPANLPAEGIPVPRHVPIRTSPVEGHTCRFRTTQATHLWPIEVTDVALLQPPLGDGPAPPDGTQSALRIRLRHLHSKPLSAVPLESLRLHLTGPEGIVNGLYESLFNNAIEVAFATGDHVTRVAADQVIGAVGFDRESAMLPYPAQSFDGYRLLTELFSFPDKFAFADLGGWQAARDTLTTREVEVWIYLNQSHAGLTPDVRAEHVRTGCVPIVNLHSKICEPIQFTRQRSDYRIVPDAARRMGSEVYSVDNVISSRADGDRRWRPFFDLGRRDEKEAESGYWHASRTESQREKDNGSDVSLQLVDRQFDPLMPGAEVVTVHATCTDRDIPVLLRQHGDGVTWHVGTSLPIGTVQCLKHPTSPLRPEVRRHAHWNLVSHLSLGHRFVEGPNGLSTLREMLRLYDFSDPNSYDPRGATSRQLVEGLVELRHNKVTRQIGPLCEGEFARGSQLTVVLDEDHYQAVGAFLFASVLQRFLGLASGINSFVETVVETKQRDGVLAHFPAHSGEEPRL